MENIKKSQAEVVLALNGTSDKPGHVPEMLGTNYPFGSFEGTRRKTLENELFFVDDRETGLTIAKFTDCRKASKFASLCGGLVRTYNCDDDKRDKEQSLQREHYRYQRNEDFPALANIRDRQRNELRKAASQDIIK